jgi:CheY-like chemotaxis protein
MVVPSIVITTIIVFFLVDLLLRMLLARVRKDRVRKEREQALDQGLRLDVSEEAGSLTRVELEQPKARILAVDDEKVILDSFRKVLVLGGYSIDTVESGPEALGLIRKHDYDFVFTDLKMPGMDGVEVTRAVKHLRPDIDVVVITGYATIETAVETVKVGAMDYVEKPFTEDELLKFVDTALIRRQARLEQSAPLKVRLVKPGTRESKSKFDLNVPAGAYVSPQHAWVTIALNGTARTGLDDLVRKVFGRIDQVELPETGQQVEKGQPLYTVCYGDYRLSMPSPVSGKVVRVNAEHAEHPEWLAIKPFELSWVCELEPANLAADLAQLKIGQEAVDWYQAELARYAELTAEAGAESGAEPEPAAADKAGGEEATDVDLLARFSQPYLQC